MSNIENIKGELKKIANNLLWSWDPEIKKVFETIDLGLWNDVGQNPIKLLNEIDDRKMSKAVNDKSFLQLFENAQQRFNNYFNKSTWFQTKQNDDISIGYFSAEFGLTECIRIYSGGLGVLSGDHLKSASDLGIPLIGVGLLYSKGYFQQTLDNDGWQNEFYIIEDFKNSPIHLQADENNDPLRVKVEIAGEDVLIQVWKINVGKISLYLLDTNIESNSTQNREITETLYGGDIETRIRQEIVMGIGGIRVLQALNLSPKVFHMNEGHSAFLSLERVRLAMNKYNIGFEEAKKISMQSNVFTTHTPVPAGIDVFPKELVNKCMQNYYSGELGVTDDEFMALGNIPGSQNLESFNMAHLAMNNSKYINGVSKLHKEVSKDLWAERFHGIDKNDIPIGSITNGVHLKTHTEGNMQRLFRKHLCGAWDKSLSKSEKYKSVFEIPDNEIWKLHKENKISLIEFARKRIVKQNLEKGIATGKDQIENILNEAALTIGFARRFATYKRATLILSDLEKLDNLINNQERPVQIIFAGKAHPKDHAGKEFIQSIYKISQDERFKNKIIFLENYNLEVAKYMVSGCDLWLNNPRRPLEASGTSGMKVVANGGLNLSILDGWWDEAYSPDVGWKIGDRENSFNSDVNDEKDIRDLFTILEEEIIPSFFIRNENNIPYLWIKKVKNSISKLTPYFNSDRMVMEYYEKYYEAAFNNQNKTLADSNLH